MPVPVGSRFIDVDFQQAVPNGQMLGCIHEPQNEMFAKFYAKSYSAFAPLIPRAEWKATADLVNPRLRKFIRNRKNQGNEGSCVFNGSAGQWQFAFAQQFGWDVDFTILSSIIGYCQYGSSPGSGSMVSDAVEYHSTVGTLPEAGHGYTYKHQFKPTGFYDARAYLKQNPDWKDTAKNFMSLEYYTVESVEEWASALLRGHPILKGRSGHCIFDFLWDYDSKGAWNAGYCNSWGDWGDPVNDVIGNSLGWDTERFIGQQYGWALVGTKMRQEVDDQLPQPVL